MRCRATNGRSAAAPKASGVTVVAGYHSASFSATGFFGTEMLYTDYTFDTKDGKSHFLPAPWNGPPGTVETQKKYRF